MATEVDAFRHHRETLVCAAREGSFITRSVMATEVASVAITLRVMNSATFDTT